jgi:DNA-binding MarR family transcriptional regulator
MSKIEKPPVRKEYLELTRLIERLHRRFLDLIRTELNRLGVRDINAVQALLLANVGDERMMIHELIERGYYQGSNVSYNIKKLTEMGYLEQARATHDRRAVNIQLTEKAKVVVQAIRDLEDRNTRLFAEHELNRGDIEMACHLLRNVERAWTDYIQYSGQ